MSDAKRHHLTSRAVKPHLRGQTTPTWQSRSSSGEKGAKQSRSSPSSQGVLDGVGERVAQVQGACHVGGWDAHHEDPSGIWC